jgi:hypothetical protein
MNSTVTKPYGTVQKDGSGRPILEQWVSAFEPRLADTDGFRGSLATSVRATGQDARTI